MGKENIIIKTLGKIIPLTTGAVKRTPKRVDHIPELSIKSLQSDVVQTSKTIAKAGKKADIPRSEVEELFYAGLTQAQIAEKLGISTATANTWLKKCGLWNARTIKKVEVMAEKGMSLPQIAEELKLPIHVVRGGLKRHGITTVGQKALKEIKKEELQKLIDSGCTTREISEQLGIDLLTTDKLLKKFNIAPLDYYINKAVTAYAKSPTEKTKMEALMLVDDFLKKLAKEEVSKNKTCLYDDYLQSLRLDFLEGLEAFKNSKKPPCDILKSLKAHKPEEIDMVMGRGEHPFRLTSMDTFSSSDEALQAVERDSLVAYLLNRNGITKNGSLTELEKELLTKKYRGLDIDEIAEEYGLVPQRVRQILDKGIKRLTAFAEHNPSLLNEIGSFI